MAIYLVYLVYNILDPRPEALREGTQRAANSASCRASAPGSP